MGLISNIINKKQWDEARKDNMILFLAYKSKTPQHEVVEEFLESVKKYGTREVTVELLEAFIIKKYHKPFDKLGYEHEGTFNFRTTSPVYEDKTKSITLR